MGLILGNYRGLPIVEHNGSLFGYRADILRFPTQKFTVASLCNVSNADAEGRSRKVADLYLKKQLQPDATAGKSLPDPATFAGQYLDPRTYTVYSFTAEDGNLLGWGSALRRKDANQFYDLFGDVITFATSAGSMQATLDINGETYFSGKRLPPLPMDEAALQDFVGNYHSMELDGSLDLTLERKTLVLKSGSNPSVTLCLFPSATVNSPQEVVSHFVFHRETNGAVSGLTVFAPSARGIEFKHAD